jgi:hypothetical protein
MKYPYPGAYWGLWNIYGHMSGFLPPVGYAFVVDKNGIYVVDKDGKFLISKI